MICFESNQNDILAIINKDASKILSIWIFPQILAVGIIRFHFRNEANAFLLFTCLSFFVCLDFYSASLWTKKAMHKVAYQKNINI